MSTSAASLSWQNQVYKKISHKMKLHSEEFEEIQLLKLTADKIRSLRKKVLKQKYD